MSDRPQAINSPRLQREAYCHGTPAVKIKRALIGPRPLHHRKSGGDAPPHHPVETAGTVMLQIEAVVRADRKVGASHTPAEPAWRWQALRRWKDFALARANHAADCAEFSCANHGFDQAEKMV
jgi:hypothetical protein